MRITIPDALADQLQRKADGAGIPLDRAAAIVLGRTMDVGLQERFLLVSNACQCSGSPLVHHFVKVDLGDEMTDFRPGFIEVIGTLSIGEKEDENGFVTSVYRLKGEFF